MTLYVVTADTYIEDSCGASIKLFGIFSDMDKAIARKRELEVRHKYFVQIDEVSMDVYCDVFLGEYIE